MKVLYFILPLATILIAICAWAFLWAVRHRQFDDLDSPAHRILFDDDLNLPPRPNSDNTQKDTS